MLSRFNLFNLNFLEDAVLTGIGFYFFNINEVFILIIYLRFLIMDKEERVRLIRKGNELFNKGDITGAASIFVTTGYRDGITRVADYYFFDRKLPLVALKFYKMVNRKDKVDEIFDRMIFALGKLLKSDSVNSRDSADDNTDSNEVEVKVHPKLKLLAEEIIRDSEKNKS